MMNWNPNLLDKYIAPKISAFTKAAIPDLSDEFDQHAHWLTNHFINNVLRAPFAGDLRQYAVNVIFRAQMSFGHYHTARNLTLKYLESDKEISLYYEALSVWECMFLNWSISVELLTKLGKGKIFEKGDGSSEQRAYELFNEVKHCGSNISNGTLAGNDSIPFWLTNNGFESKGNSLLYEELAGLIKDVARLANEIQDPVSFLTPP